MARKFSRKWFIEAKGWQPAVATLVITAAMLGVALLIGQTFG